MALAAAPCLPRVQLYLHPYPSTSATRHAESGHCRGWCSQAAAGALLGFSMSRAVYCRRPVRRCSASDTSTPEKENATTLKARLTAWWRKNARMDSKQLRKMGLMCLLSYGFVSNVNAVILILLATYRAIVATGASPLAEKAALKQFGITWLGLYMVSNLLRPLRISLALGISPVIDKLVNRIQVGLGCKRWLAVTLAVVLLNIVGTIAILYFGMTLVSASTGVEVQAGQLGQLLHAVKAAKSNA
eukprot:TRINITY_DN76521_c0_g1_i1.p1 TRINITY_DN76521_c0_g1~~TRINITY_DN76521_c0_g1_i1.p1  ORF type:complete len:245 (+),score=31.65 TRINITY_DN76521_c0_g1_i1:42-776(+)